MPARFALVLALLLAGALALRPRYASAGVALSAAGLHGAAAARGGCRAGLLLVAARLVDVGDSDIVATRQPALVDHQVVVTGFFRHRQPGERRRKTVRRTPGAISYAASSATRGRSGLTEVAIDGAAPSDENVTHGRYPFWSYGHMYTNGRDNADVARFIGFLQRNAGLVVRNGYIPLGAMNVVEPNR